MITRSLLATPLLLILILVATPDRAEAQWEVEVDPFAYALSGFSLHVARVAGPMRLSAGTFGIDVPEWLHGNEGWDARMRGAGLKLDYLGSSIDGFFAGVDGGYMRLRHTLAADGQGASRDAISVGIRAGYRMTIGSSGLYVVPWTGIGYQFKGEDVTISGETFDERPLVPFATVHVGWSFR